MKRDISKNAKLFYPSKFTEKKKRKEKRKERESPILNHKLCRNPLCDNNTCLFH